MNWCYIAFATSVRNLTDGSTYNYPPWLTNELVLFATSVRNLTEQFEHEELSHDISSRSCWYYERIETFNDRAFKLIVTQLKNVGWPSFNIFFCWSKMLFGFAVFRLVFFYRFRRNYCDVLFHHGYEQLEHDWTTIKLRDVTLCRITKKFTVILNLQIFFRLYGERVFSTVH